jgi:hypothetical protein
LIIKSFGLLLKALIVAFMNPIQIHLIVNHIAVVGFPIILLIGVLAIVFKSSQYRGLVYGLTIVCSLGGFIAYFSGGEAERWLYDDEALTLAFQNQYEEPSASASEDWLSLKSKKNKLNPCFSEKDLALHGEFAEETLVFLALCCGIAIIASISYFKLSGLEAKLFWVLMFAISLSCFWLGKTAHQGGRISHGAIR